jgi:hypothetical protein
LRIVCTPNLAHELSWFLEGAASPTPPTLNRKARIIADWAVAPLFRRDLAQLGSFQRPREPFIQALAIPADASPAASAYPDAE